VLWALLYPVTRCDELKLTLPFDSAEIRAVLLDVEGTTTPIDFVINTLFPFSGSHAEDFLRRHSQEPGIAESIEALRKCHEQDRAAGAVTWQDEPLEQKLASAAAYVRWLIARDSKLTPLKTLQGKIWEEGFQSGQLKGEVYPDVAPAFARWRAENRRIAIFSSGSVLAQKLLFSHSTAGDLSSFLEGYFDTTTGPKREAESYAKIARAIGLQEREIIFVSDVASELDAANSAGMKTAHSLRGGISPLKNASHRAISTFDELFRE
jgi:enolase-phosphatase E1